MDAEIVAIGSELLLGTTIDTNSAYLAGQLARSGIRLLRTSVVDDDISRIAAAVDAALDRADLVVCTGGLGPTVDDVTREAVGEALGRPLEFRQELMDQVAARFAAMRRDMPATNRRQAYAPQGARAIPNPRGTAPAFLVEDARGTVVVLPGVPDEMRFLCETALVPYLRDERGIRDVILVQTLHAVGLGESVISERIADLMRATNPAVGISAKKARYELRISAKAESPAAAQALLDATAAEIGRRLGGALLGTEQLDEQIVRLLTERGETLALYEGHVVAPIYHALARALAHREERTSCLSGVLIHTLDQPIDEVAAASLAHSGAVDVHDRWRSSLGLGMQVATRSDADGFTAVSLALIFAGGSRHMTQRYDLNQPEGWGYVGTLALDLLRRHLLGESG